MLLGKGVIGQLLWYPTQLSGLALAGFLVLLLGSLEEMHTYPLRDNVPANILSPSNTTLEDYKDRCYAFFTAGFSVLRRRLHEMGAASMSSEDLIAAWSAVMCVNLVSTHRSEFFRDVDLEYQTPRYWAQTGLTHKNQHPSTTQDMIAAQIQGPTKETGGLSFEN